MSNSDITKKICCACLSINRKLFQLYTVLDGFNIFYSLLQCDPDAFRSGFLNNSLMVCWECRAAISNIKRFRDQINFALKQLRIVTSEEFVDITSLSHLKTHTNPMLKIETEVFIDCGPHYDIKKEDTVDNEECIETNSCTNGDIQSQSKETNSINVLSEEQQITTYQSDKNKLNASDENSKDDIINRDGFEDEFTTQDPITDISKKAKNKLEKNGQSKVKKKRKIKSRKTNQILCTECDMSFDNKGAKWKHIQIAHKEGHKCVTCGKVFSFKFNLQRHQRTHAVPAPLAPCPTCGKLVSPARLPLHARTHSVRSHAACAPCRRQFVTRDTYEAHLRNTRAHATGDIFRYPCQLCDKKYRSRGELRDHVAYKHDNQKQKCPVCEKYLATRRSLARHVRRAHEGIREGARDKMCDYCGQTFRDKKSLCEHIWRHTGARPLACAVCPRAFRQRAALYEHMKRLHPNG